MMPATLAMTLGPFDEDYPLYYEDSDLTRRIRQSGYRCMLVPESEMVHLFNKSAGQFEEESRRKLEFSRRLYFRKHYGHLGAWLGETLVRSMKPPSEAVWRFSEPTDLGERHTPPSLRLPGGGPYVLELTLDPLFTLAIGHLDHAEELIFPTGVWDHFDAARYFVRALALPDLRPVGGWTFAKTTPCRPVQGYQDFLHRLETSEKSEELCV